MVAVTIASILGITTIGSGFWVKSLSNKLVKIHEKTNELEIKITQYEKKISSSINILDAKKKSILKELSSETSLSLNDYRDNFNKLVNRFRKEIITITNQKKKDILKTGVDEILKELNNGRHIFKAKSLYILNKNGIETVVITSDSGGDGAIRVNTESGKIRYLLSLQGNVAQSGYYNNKEKCVLLTGTFSDIDYGFFQLRDSKDKITLFQVQGGPKGGLLNLYSNSSGKDIVYIGPEGNTGNGIVNVMGLHGEPTKSHTP